MNYIRRQTRREQREQCAVSGPSHPRSGRSIHRRRHHRGQIYLGGGPAFKKDGGDEADFISCVAFGKTAEFLEKWFRRGQRLGLTGRIQTGSYVNQEGTKIYTTDVVTENVEFVESKGASAEDGGSQQRPAPVSDLGDGFMNIPDGVEDDGLPFN